MELCEDLVMRMKDYGVLHIQDYNHVAEKIRNNWQVTLQNKPSIVEKIKDKANTGILGFLV